MGESKAGRWLLVSAVIMLLLCLGCCCGCAGFWHLLPDMLVAAFTEELPLEAPTVTPEPRAGERLERRFLLDEPVRISGQELVQLADPQGDDELHSFWVEFGPDGRAELVLSVWAEEFDGYFNLRTVGELELEHGWFTHMSFDELVVSGWDLGQYMAGEELAQHANRSLADQRAQNPEMSMVMDEIERIYVDGDALVVELAPGGYQRLRALRD